MKFQGKTLTVDMLEDGIAELRFDCQQGSVNKFDAITLSELGHVVEELGSNGDVRGLCLSSGKNVFVVGADITEFSQWFAKEHEELVEDLLRIHKTFSAIEDLPFPTVAAINGFALGGGFEVCLACDYRIVSTQARVGLPEIKLGIFPGWGGTIRLPRLIGADNALEWIGFGQDKRPREALEQGAVDAVVEPDRLRAAAIQLLNQCIDGKLDYQARRVEKRMPLRLTDVERTMVFETAKAVVSAKAGPHYPAPMTALKCMEQHAVLERDDASRIETEAFAQLSQTEAAHNLVGLFLNDQALNRAAKSYSRQAEPVALAAVLGAGVMGGGIAYQTARRGVPIVMKDINPKAIESGLSEVRSLLLKQVARGRLTPEKMGEVLTRVNPTLTYGDVAPADLVVEAVVEKEEVKTSVLQELETVIDDAAVIASNTSTISISKLGTALKHPQRFCGMHFFNPVPVMPLVEVIRGDGTSEQAIATTVSFAKNIGKNPIVVKDCPGFLVNRVLFPYLNAFSALLRDGADFRQVDRVMEGFGWPMGPAYLLDVIGLDIACHAGAVLAEGYPDRMRTGYETAVEALYKAQRLGQKSGRGFYQYETERSGKPKKKVDESVYGTIASVRNGERKFDDQAIVDRMMLPLCLETVRCLEDGIVDSPVTADMGLIWGIGFPPFRGGALRYIDTIGVAAFCDTAERYAELGASYRPSERLRAMAADGASFYRGTNPRA